MAPEILLTGVNEDENEEDGDEEETLNQHKKFIYSKESDIWSYGIIIYELICRRLPFNGLYHNFILYK